MYLFQHAFSTLLINVHYVFTFHYVSISTSYCNGFISRNDIYIPLCIYFNLCNSLANVFLILIYIPLCIYFNSLSGRNRNSFICIYIPLCIYFNLFDDPHLCDVVLFTFHYVSISTNLKCHSVMFLQIFTFHYVSISTCLTDTKLCTSLYLHSTMYLFQRYCRMQSGKEQRNLHSTMYLFQQQRNNTSIPDAIIYIPLCIYFNCIHIYRIEHLNHIYIPLCIYFNLISCIMILSIRNLHSTMYLFQRYMFDFIMDLI